MQKDSVELIREAEQKAQQTVADARRAAAELVRNARAEAQRRHEDTMNAARSAAQDTLEAAKAEGSRRGEADKGRYLEQGQQLQKKAAGRRDKAIEAVLEAIING